MSTSCPLVSALSSPRPTDPGCNQKSFSLDREEAKEATRKEGMGLALHCTALHCILDFLHSTGGSLRESSGA